jgi:hypothetical protein
LLKKLTLQNWSYLINIGRLRFNGARNYMPFIIVMNFQELMMNYNPQFDQQSTEAVSIKST